YNLRPGDSLTLLTGKQARTVRLAGLLQPADELSRSALDGLVLADISTAQEVLNMPGRISTVDLILPPNADTRPIEALLPANAQLQPASLRNQALRQMTAAFELNLTALSLLALLVGMFLIYNTISFSVVQRRPVLGTLRCLGVTRREIFGLVLTEALLLSAVGAAVGLGLGVLLGRGLVGLVTRTINDLFFTLTVQNVSLSGFTLLKGALAGLGAGLLAALVPAWEATTVPPVNALKRSVEETRLQQRIPALTAAGLLVMAAGWGLLNAAAQSLLLSFGALFALLIGAALLTPVVTRLLMSGVRPPAQAALGIIGAMAPRDITRALSRTAVSIAALMLAVSVIIGVGIMIDSFRGTVAAWLDNVLAADIYISPAGQNLRLAGEIDPEFIRHIEQNPAVAAVGLLRSTTVFAPGNERVEIRAVSPRPDEKDRPMMWGIGPPAELSAALDSGAVLVSEVFARRHNLPLDAPSAVTLITEAGPRDFPVVGVFYDYAVPELGYVLLRLDTYRAHWPGDQTITGVGLYLQPDARPRSDELSREITGEFAARYRLSVSSNGAIKQNALEIFDRTFTITAALRLLATVVAFIGVLSAVMSLQLERTRELGTLRANGMSLAQLWGKTLLETGLMGLTAGLMALPLGWLLAFVLIRFINLRSFGWTLAMESNLSIYGMALLVALTAALLAGIYPMLRLNRLQIATAVRQE
ncbi:MAG: ABC transporter permease, partial [Chloroflexi bacterium]